MPRCHCCPNTRLKGVQSTQWEVNWLTPQFHLSTKLLLVPAILVEKWLLHSRLHQNINRKYCYLLPLTSMSKSRRLNAVLNREQKYAMLGTSHHDWISRNREKFIQTSLWAELPSRKSRNLCPVLFKPT